MLNLGNGNINKLYLGSTEINKAYLGSELVYGASIIPVDNITSYWKFNGNSNDSVGSNNGVDTSLSYTTGLIGNCVDFSGSALSKVQVADAPSLNFGNGLVDSDYSFVTLVRFFSTANQWIFNKRNLSGETLNRQYQLVLYNGKLTWYAYDESSGGQKITEVTFTPNTSNWYVLGVSAKSGLQPKLYIDAVNVANTAVNPGTYTAMEALPVPLVIGKASFLDTLSMNGLMNMLAVFNTTLTQEEITAITDKLLVDNEHLI